MTLVTFAILICVSSNDLVLIEERRVIILKKVKINILIIFALILSAISMALYAYHHFNAREIAYGTLFTFLSVLFISLVIMSIIRNKTIQSEADSSSSPPS